MATIVVWHYKGPKSVIKDLPQEKVAQAVEKIKKNDRRPPKRISVNSKVVWAAKGVSKKNGL